MAEIRTLCDLLFHVVEAHRKPDLLLVKRAGAWQRISTEEFAGAVRNLSCGLMALGVKPGEKVALLSEDRPEWAVADFAILSAGAADVPLYPTLNAKDSAYIVNDCDARLAVVSTPEQANKLLSMKGALPSLRDIVIMDPPGPGQGNLLRWDEVLARGAEYAIHRPDLHRKSAGAVKPEDLASIIYTSGTTGVPKGVMLTHRNFVENARGGMETIAVGETDLALVFLPLSHSFERLADYCYFWGGCSLAYAESLEKVADNMGEVRPTVMAAVPRFYEKVYGRVLDQAARAPYAKKALIHWSVAVARVWAERRALKRRIGPWLALKHRIADALLFRRLRERVGGRLRFFISGGAPLAKELAEFFYGCGIRICEGYGLTESAPVITINRLEEIRFGSIGKPLSNVEVALAEDGELLARGPNIMRGYYKLPEATAEVLTADGWLKTGDIAHRDEEGYLYITDRKKELLVTAGGKNVAPQPIENLLKTNKYVAQAVLVGDRRPFVTALIVPNWANVRDYARSRGVADLEPARLCNHPQVKRLFGHVLERTNAHLSRYEQVRKCRLLLRELTLEEGELTPTLKVKRRVVDQKFRSVIDALYPDGD